MESRFDSMWSLAFIAGDHATGERHLGNAGAVIRGTKVQGSNSEWYWEARYERSDGHMIFHLDRMALHPGQPALTDLWADIFKNITLRGEEPGPDAKEFEVGGYIQGVGGGFRLKIRFTRPIF